MPTMESVQNNVHYSLFKGEPGTRKSTQALSYPKPQFWMSFDWKMNALVLPMRAWGIDPKLIEYEDFKDWSSARSKLETFQLNFPYKTLVIDSITSIADSMLGQVKRMKQGTTKAGGAAAGRSVGGIAVNEMEDYNAEAAGLNELIALTKDIQRFHKIDVILIAHVIRTESRDPSGKQNITRVLVTAGKKPAAKIPAYCDESYHFGVEASLVEGTGGDYTVLTSNSGDDYARTTLQLPRVIKTGNEPLYDKWILPAIKQMEAPLTLK